MPSSYSSLLRLELMATGEKSATWGDITNTNLGTLVEKSIAGSATVNVAAGNVTLTALNGTDDEARCAILVVTGSPGVSRNIVAPSSAKTYSVINGSNAAVVIKGSATTGVTLAAGERAFVAWSGSDFVRVGVGTDAPSFTGTASFVNLAVSGTTSVAALTASGATSVVNLAASGTFSATGAATFGNSVTLGSGTSIGSLNLQMIVNKTVQSGIAVGHGDGTFNNRVAMFADSSTQLVGWDTSYSSTFNGYVWRVVGTTKMRLNVDGNLGLGYTPNAWRANANAFQSGVFLSLWQQSNGASNIGFGVFEDGPNTFRYTTTGDPVSVYSQISGRHIWYGAAAGTANATATLASRMELNATSDLLVAGRITAGSGAPLLSAATLLAHAATNQNVALGSFASTTPKVFGCTDLGALAGLALAGTAIQFSVDDATTTMRLDATGLGLGRSATYKLDIAGTARLGFAGAGTGGSVRYMRDSGADGWVAGILASVGATNWSLYDIVSGAERLTIIPGTGTAAVIDASGNLGIGVSPSARLSLDSSSTGLMATLNSTNANGGYTTWANSGTVVADVGTGAQIHTSGSATSFGINARTGSVVLATAQTKRLEVSNAGVVDILAGSGNLRIGSAITRFESSEQTTPSTTGLITVAHGGPRAPDIIRVVYRCKTAEHGFAVGDEVDVRKDVADTAREVQIYSNATNVYYQYIGSGTPPAVRTTSNTTAALTASSWRVVLRAIWL